MTTNIIKFCTAALAGTLIGITYERMPPMEVWPSVFTSVSASSALTPKIPPEAYQPVPYKLPDINPKQAGENLLQSSKYGLPSKENLRLFNDFILSYDRRLRAPAWVFEHLTPEKLSKPKAGRKENFQEDETIHEYFRAKLADFRGSGFDRGHMAAAGNHKFDQDALDQTFSLSNISPQVPQMNRGGWERLETYVRFRAKRAKNLYVVTGPLYLPRKARDGNLYVTYRVLGNNHVSVPTHYFKVMLVETRDGKFSMEAFLMPNDEKMEDIKINDYRVPIDRLDIIERALGVIFFNELSRSNIETPTQVVDGFKEGKRHGSKEITD